MKITTIKYLFKKKSERKIDEELLVSKWKAIIVSTILVIIILFVMIYSSYFYYGKKKIYINSVAEQRIVNSSGEINKYINYKYKELNANFEFFKEDAEIARENNSASLSASVLSKHESRINTGDENSTIIGYIMNSHIDYIDEHNVDFDFNNLSALFLEPNHKLVFFKDNYLVLAESLSNISQDIKGVIVFISIENLEKQLKTDVYDGKAIITVVDDNGNVVLRTGNNVTTTSDNVYNLYPELLSKKDNLVNGDNIHGELTSNGEVYKYYTELFASNPKYRVFVSVPRSELVYQIQKITSIGMHILYIVLVLAGVAAVFSASVIRKLISNKEKTEAFDSKTGLLKVPRFMHDMLATVKPSNIDYAIVYIDVVRFKIINEIYGFTIADKILEKLAREFKSLFEEDEFGAYVNADNFILLLKAESVAQLKGRLSMFKESLKFFKYMDLEGINLYMGVNVIKYYEDRNLQAEIDRAKYAKESIKKRAYLNDYIAFYDDNMYEQELEKADLEKRAPQAVLNREFEVFFQLKRNIRNDNWCGSEALVRWRNKDNTLISPGKFIPLFEDNGFITELDMYVFENVCQLLRESLDRNDVTVPVSVNLSKRHFHDLKFIEKFENIISKYKVPHELIEFEITEGLVVENIDIFKEFISYIHSNGYLCAMDDFGSGYSSFNVIRELDFDTIKLDGKFFKGSNGFDKESQVIVESLIDLCHRLGKTVVAEGVEEKEQVEFLKSKDCDVIQGFYYAKPVPWDDYNKKLKI